MAHLCPECNEECDCHDDTGRVVSLHMPADCEHCARDVDEAEDDDFEDDGFTDDLDEMNAGPCRRW